MARHKKKIEQNLDSLLDILSNVVGVMVLISVIIVLNSQTTSLNLGTPVLGEPPVHARRILFECVNNRVTIIDVDGLDKKIQAIQTDYRARAAAMPSARQLSVLLKRQDVGDKYYRVNIDLKDGVNFLYTPREKTQGETPSDFKKENSRYMRLLREENPEKRWLFFVVRPSGYEVFRAARRRAKEEFGFAVGWDPITEGLPIIMRTGGGVGTTIQ